ncbi:hypothetical protein GGR57DRAFT_161649 [Xylariaceae sp. FL1272]|nr:hypothetical protein GGR57DRAFT_161649 [Xylariaceae sp. FL1272]
MARTKASNKASSSSAVAKSRFTRPGNGPIVLLFAVFSAAGLWLMRVETGIKDIPVGFIDQIENGKYHNGVPLREVYTGIEALDLFRYLVAAFIAGPLAWDEGVRVQQLHFLVQFFAVVCLWNIEACRSRNAKRIFSYTGLFAVLYQTVGGAVIIPLWFLSFLVSSKSDTYYKSGRQVNIPHARGILFAVVVGYLIPTLAMYTPSMSPDTAQLLTFIWQPAPTFVNLLLFLSSRLLPATAARGERTPDVKYLKRVYTAAALVSAINHLVTVYICYTSSNPELSFTHVFIPNRNTWTDSATLGLHYIFQIDWWGCFTPSLIFALVSVWDVHRILLGGASATQLIGWVVYILGLTATIGPGGMLAVVWSWREDRLVMIESGVRGTVKKPKTA